MGFWDGLERTPRHSARNDTHDIHVGRGVWADCSCMITCESSR